MKRSWSNIARLSAAQALGGANASVIFATGAVIGSILAPRPAYATAPISMFVVGMAAGTLPCGWLSQRYGRRVAFMAGTGCGAVCGLVAALAIWRGSFPLYCFATFLGGLYAAVVQSFRFAAADGVGAELRPKAVSWVMAGGVFAGVLGPQLVTWTMEMWSPYLFAASYVAQTVVAVITMAVLAGVDIPKPPAAEIDLGRPLLEIVRKPAFIAAALCGVISYTLMNLIMTSAPLAMRLCGLPQSDSNIVIQWHVVAMYGLSFVTGALIARFGARTIVAIGLAMIALAAAVGLAGIAFMNFWAGLALLGFGWNFGFVGASAMVMDAHRPEERTKVQAFNDFLIFGVMALGSFSSGQILDTYGWGTVNAVAFPLLAIAVATLLARSKSV